MPRVKIDRFIDDKPKLPVKQTPKSKAAIGSDLSPAIDTIPVNNQPTKTLKKLAGTPYLVDVDTGLLYLEPAILKSLKNN